MAASISYVAAAGEREMQCISGGNQYQRRLISSAAWQYRDNGNEREIKASVSSGEKRQRHQQR